MNESKNKRNPWPIAIIAYFVVFITFIAVFIVFATRQKIDLVSHTYYEEEVRYQSQIDQLNRALPLDANVLVAYDATRQVITITLPVKPRQSVSSGRVRFYRPADASLDCDVPLNVNAAGVQEVDASKFKNGFWKVRIEWNFGGESLLFEKPVIVETYSQNR